MTHHYIVNIWDENKTNCYHFDTLENAKDFCIKDHEQSPIYTDFNSVRSYPIYKSTNLFVPGMNGMVQVYVQIENFTTSRVIEVVGVDVYGETYLRG